MSGQVQLEQLVQVNAGWQGQAGLFERIDKAALPLYTLDEKDLIAAHLRLVLHCLRNNTPICFSKGQLKNRAHCLSILEQYIQNGVFPKNLHHATRTPYFIDDAGNACAVGYLMLRTGQDSIVRVINQRSNYAYIKELASNTPQLVDWANAKGFTVEELAWIQPGYDCFHPSCPPDIIKNVSCKGGFDGCIGLQSPSPNMVGPLQYKFYYKSGPDFWQQIPQLCDLSAGEYKTRITDANGLEEEYLHTITEPDALLLVDPVVTNNSGNCNGTITLQITGGKEPYTITWGNNQHTIQIDQLCAGIYSATISDDHGCQKEVEATVDSVTTAVYAPSQAIHLTIYPSPTAGFLYVDNQNDHECFCRIYDLRGVEKHAVILKTGINGVNLTSYPAGNYVVRADCLYGSRTRIIGKL